MTASSTSWPSMMIPPSSTIKLSEESSSVPAIMNYVSEECKDISTRRDLGGGDSTLVGAIWKPTQVNVNNARILDGDDRMTLDKNGFQLWSESNGKEKDIQKLDFCNQDEVVDNYYPICEDLVRDALKSQRSSSSPPLIIQAFDHNIRSNDKASVGEIKRASMTNEEDDSANPQVQNPAGIVHADYTKTSAPRRLNDLSNPPKLNDVLRPKLIAQNKKSLLDPSVVKEALEGKRRYAFINIWRSIDTKNTVKNPPLACVDATTTTIDELRMFKIHYFDRVGENYFISPPVASGRREHGWYYYPEMTMDEVILLKQWDSRGAVACGAHSDGEEKKNGNKNRNGDEDKTSTFTIHSAFIDPTYGKDAPPRKSIEVRCVVIWDEP